MQINARNGPASSLSLSLSVSSFARVNAYAHVQAETLNAYGKRVGEMHVSHRRRALGHSKILFTLRRLSYISKK